MERNVRVRRVERLPIPYGVNIEVTEHPDMILDQLELSDQEARQLLVDLAQCLETNGAPS